MPSCAAVLIFTDGGQLTTQSVKRTENLKSRRQYCDLLINRECQKADV